VLNHKNISKMNPFLSFVGDLPALPPVLKYKSKSADAPKQESKVADYEAESLSQSITVHKMEQLATVAHAMHRNNTVCLYKCRGSVAAERDIKPKSAYQYLLRFFQTGKTEELEWLCFAMLIKTLKEIDKAYFLIDRTEWKHGGKWYNLLVIGLVVNQVFIPLACHDLGERKSSSTEERLNLWLEFEAKMKWINNGILPKMYIAGDREFGTGEWADFLDGRGISFVLRAKGNHKWDFLVDYTTISGKTVRLATLARWGRRKGISKFTLFSKATNRPITLHIVHIEHAPKGQELFLCLLSNLETTPQAADFYAKRWKIESCFKHLKSNGFNLEKLNILPTHTVELMFMILALLYTLTIVEGIAHNYATTVRIIKYKNGATYPAESLFAFARQIMAKTITSLDDFYKRFIFFWEHKNDFIFDFQLITH
jgi:Transposase DDE domain